MKLQSANKSKWGIADINNQFHRMSKDVVVSMRQQPEYEEHASQIIRQLEEFDGRSFLRMAFIGQYSSGKSTIISALTGRKDITIHADIATDQATDYNWNGIVLTDTPGLFTERKDHDSITYEAIKASDMLVFTITSDLFDNIILDNFIKLAYEQSYRYKMLLLVNKMSMESGEFELLKSNYMESLRMSLELHNFSIRDFSVCFIDAADYIEATDLNDIDLVQLSNFEEFIALLNNFVERKGLLSRLDTPIRFIRDKIDDALLANQNEEENKLYFDLLNRVEFRVKQSMNASLHHFNKVVGELRSSIIELGSNLALMIGDQEVDVEAEARLMEDKITDLAGNASEEIETLLTQEQEELAIEVNKVIDSEVGKAFIEYIETKKVDVSDIDSDNIPSSADKVKSINNIFEKITGSGLKMFGDATQKIGFMGSSAVSGTTAHKTVYTVGKWFGVKFKPWQAVNVAKGIGNVLKMLGPIMIIVTAILEVKDVVDKEKRIQELRNAKDECRSSFVVLAEDMENQFQSQFDNFKKTSYLTVLNDISEQRKQAIEKIESKGELESDLKKYRSNLNDLIDLLGTA